MKALLPRPRGEEVSSVHAHESAGAGAPPCKINSFSGSNAIQAWLDRGGEKGEAHD